MQKETDDKKPELEEKVEYLFKIIGRYDTYINSTNSKASLVIAWNGVVIGTILLKYNEILANYPSQGWGRHTSTILLTLVGAASVFSNALIFNVVLPFLKPSSKSETKLFQGESALFFGAVSKLSASEYLTQMTKQTNETALADLTDQAVILAQALAAKMELIRVSIIGIMVELAFVFILLVIKLFL